MRSTLIRSMAPLVAVALLAAACGDDDDPTADPTADPTGAASTAATATTGATTGTSSAASGAPVTTTAGSSGPGGTCTEDRSGGAISIGIAAEPTGLDPALVPGSAATGSEVLAQIYDTLVEYDAAAGTYAPRVAEALEPDDTFATWTLTLREGMTFGNGDPFTAEAVKASIERFAELSTGPYNNLVLKITEMEVVDEQTLVFHLDEPWSGFPYTLAIQPGMIVNTAVAEAAGEAFGQDPSGASVGAYELASFATGEEIVLRARDDYWDGPVCLDELRFVPEPADATRHQAFEAGDLDVTWLRDPRVIELAGDVAGLDYFVNAATVILFNVGVGAPAPTNDLKVRQGLQMALDVEAINERANEGAGLPTSAVIGDGSLYYAGLEGPQQDVAAATARLDEAKADGWDGSVRLLCDNSRRDSALAIQAQWEAAGATVEVEFTPNFNPLIEAVIVNQDFDAACWGQNITDESLWAGFSNSMYSTSPSNYGGAGDEQLDGGIDALRVAANDEDVQAALTTIQESWTASVPSLVMSAALYRTIHTDEIVGLQGTSNSVVFYDDAYIE